MVRGSATRNAASTPATTPARRHKAHKPKSEAMSIPRAVFGRVLRDILQAGCFMCDQRITAEAVEAFQTASESMLEELFRDAQRNAVHAGRETVMSPDFRLAVERSGLPWPFESLPSSLAALPPYFEESGGEKEEEEDDEDDDPSMKSDPATPPTLERSGRRSVNHARQATPSDEDDDDKTDDTDGDDSDGEDPSRALIF